MSSESKQSYISSDNNEDYLLKGLNWRKEGDISHLPQAEQKVIRRQKAKAKEQGAFKYIAPLKGRKPPVHHD